MAKLTRYEENMRWLEEEVGKLTNMHTPEENAQWFEAEVKKLAERRNRSSNQESSIVDSTIEQFGANSANFGTPWANFGAYMTNLGVTPVNFEIAPSIQPTSSNFPPPISYHYEAPSSMSTNYGGQPTNNWGAHSFMSNQGESYYQDSLYRDSNFGVYQQSNSNFGFSNSRTVLVKINFELYPISSEVLHWFLSGIGNLGSIERFDHGNPFHSRIYFQDRDSAMRAIHWFDGRCIYDGCCQLELFLEAETINRASEMDFSNQQSLEDYQVYEQGKQSLDFSIVDESQDRRQERDSTPEAVDDYILQEVPYRSSNISPSDQQENQGLNLAIEDKLQVFQKEIEASSQDFEEDSKELQMKFHSSKVISHTLSSFEVAVVEVASKKMDESAEDLIDTVMADFVWNAYKVFDEMHNGVITVMGRGSWNFYPGGLDSMDFRTNDVADVIEMEKVISSCVESTPIVVHKVLTVKGIFEIPVAHKVLVEMPIRHDQLITRLVEEKMSEIAIADWNQYLAVSTLELVKLVFFFLCSSAFGGLQFILAVEC